jgi:hypothetical protein
VQFLKYVNRSVRKIESTVPTARFAGCNIVGETFEHISLSGYDLSKINAQGTRFFDCLFQGANMTNGNFSGAIFEKCDFDEADLRCADFSRTVVSQCSFYEAKTAGLDTFGAVFDEVVGIKAIESHSQWFCDHRLEHTSNGAIFYYLCIGKRPELGLLFSPRSYEYDRSPFKSPNWALDESDHIMWCNACDAAYHLSRGPRDPRRSMMDITMRPKEDYSLWKCIIYWDEIFDVSVPVGSFGEFHFKVAHILGEVPQEDWWID